MPSPRRPSPRPAFLAPAPISSRPSPSCSRYITPLRKRKLHRHSTMHFLDPVHTLPEFLNQLVVSCGIGFAGIAGAKATERARALTAGDHQAERMEAAALEIDRLRRRRELKDVGGLREWDDIGVDRFGGVKVWLEDVPEIGGRDELREFDRLLGDTPNSERE